MNDTQTNFSVGSIQNRKFKKKKENVYHPIFPLSVYVVLPSSFFFYPKSEKNDVKENMVSKMAFDRLFLSICDAVH